MTGCFIPSAPTTASAGGGTLNAIECGLRDGLYFEPTRVSDKLLSTILPNWKIRRRGRPFPLACSAIPSTRASPPLPATLVRRGDRRLLHCPRRQPAGARLRLFRGGVGRAGGGQAAHPRRSWTHRRQHSQATGAAAARVMSIPGQGAAAHKDFSSGWTGRISESAGYCKIPCLCRLTGVRWIGGLSELRRVKRVAHPPSLLPVQLGHAF